MIGEFQGLRKIIMTYDGLSDVEVEEIKEAIDWLIRVRYIHIQDEIAETIKERRKGKCSIIWNVKSASKA